MIVSKLKFLLLITLCSFALLFANAQPRFYSEALQELYGLLPESCKQDSLFCCKKMVLEEDTVNLNYQIDESGFLVHIGYNFLNITDSIIFNRTIVQFLEREFLKWLVANNEDEILLKYEIDNLFVKYKGNSINAKFLKNKKELIAILSKTSEFNVERVNQNYAVKISNSGKNEMEFVFPNDPKLILGMDKKERDDLISNQLKRHKIKSYRNFSIDSTNLKLVNDSIFIQNGSYYLIPSINNDVFVQKKDSLFEVILVQEFMNETFINTMLGLSSRDYEYHIKHVKYGYNIEKYEVCSKNFYDYFSTDYQLFFGIETCYENNLSGTLVFQDRETEYIHLAYINCTMDDFLNENNIKVKLHTNIPRSSLRNLFGELEEN